MVGADGGAGGHAGGGEPEGLDRRDEEGAGRGRETCGVKLVDVVHGDDQAEVSDDRALALVGSYPHLEVIMAPTTVGIRAAAKAMRTKTCAAWSAWRWSISRIG